MGKRKGINLFGKVKHNRAKTEAHDEAGYTSDLSIMFTHVLTFCMLGVKCKAGRRKVD